MKSFERIKSLSCSGVYATKYNPDLRYYCLHSYFIDNRVLHDYDVEHLIFHKDLFDDFEEALFWCDVANADLISKYPHTKYFFKVCEADDVELENFKLRIGGF